METALSPRQSVISTVLYVNSYHLCFIPARANDQFKAGFRDPNRGTQDTMPIQKTQSSQQTSLQKPQVELDALSRLVYTQRALDRLKAVKTQARQKDSKLHHGHESQAQVTCECDAGGSENDAAEGLVSYPVRSISWANFHSFTVRYVVS